MKLRQNLPSLAALALILVVGVVANLLPSARVHAQLGSVQTWAGNSGGTANAITLNVHNVGALSDLLGVPIRFVSGTSGNNTGPTTVTINLDSGGTLGPVVLRRPTTNLGIQLLSGSELGTNNIDEITYDGTEFVITSRIDMTPIGTAIDIRVAGSRGFLVEDGSCVSQTTYAALFAAIGTTYGGGCGGGLFPVPDSRGTASIALDGQGVNGLANRITSASCAVPNTLSSSVCGGQTQTIGTTNLPASQLSVSVSGTVSVFGSGTVTSTGSNPGVGVSTTSTRSDALFGSSVSTQAGGSFTGGQLSANSAVTATGTTGVINMTSSGPIGLTSTGSNTLSGNTVNMGSGTPLVSLNPMLRVTRVIKY
jgi:microcystin-dependent protein